MILSNPNSNHPGTWRVWDELRSIIVGVGLRSRPWRKRDDHRIDCKYRSRQLIGTKPYSDQFYFEGQTRAAGEVGT